MKIAFIGLGALAMAISLLEIFAHLLGGLQTLRHLTSRVLGRSSEQSTDMEDAMFWVRVIGLLIAGALAIVVGLSVLGA